MVTRKSTSVTKSNSPVKKAVKKVVEPTASDGATKSTAKTAPTKLAGTTGKVGNVGSMSELAYSPNGTSWLRFSLAYTPYDPQSKKQGETVWYECTCFRNLAENVAQCISQGMRVVVSGRPEIRKWTDDDGVEHEQKAIICDGVGPDLTFATASVERIFRGKAASSTTEYDEEPF